MILIVIAAVILVVIAAMMRVIFDSVVSAWAARFRHCGMSRLAARVAAMIAMLRLAREITSMMFLHS
jgi:hypothetical protein